MIQDFYYAKLMLALAQDYASRGEHKLAAEILSKAKQILIALDHFDTIECLQMLGKVYYILGDLDSAHDELERAQRAAEYYYDIHKTIYLGLRCAAVYDELIDLYLTYGNISKAQTTAQKYISISASLYKQDKSIRWIVQAIARANKSYGRVVQMQGNVKLAFKHYRAYRRFYEDLDRRFADEVSLYGLSDSFEMLASLHASVGQVKKALNLYLKNLSISEVFATRDLEAVKYVQYQQDYAGALLNVADMHTTLGDYMPAIGYFIKHLQIYNGLYERDIRNPAILNGIKVSHERLGYIYSILGDLSQCLGHYHKLSLVVVENAEQSPKNVGYVYDMALAYQNLGIIYERIGDVSQSTHHYHQFNKMCQVICQAFPSHSEYKLGLCLSYQRVGALELRKGNYRNAKSLYQKAMRAARRLVHDNGSNLANRRSLGLMYSNIAEVKFLSGDKNGALLDYKKGKAIFEKLSETSRRTVENSLNIFLSDKWIASVYFSRKEYLLAQQYNESARLALEHLQKKTPDNIILKQQLGWVYCQTGSIYMRLNTIETAGLYYKKMHAIFRRLIAKEPQNMFARQGLAESVGMVGMLNLIKYARRGVGLFLEYYKLWKDILSHDRENIYNRNNYTAATIIINILDAGSSGGANADFINAIDEWEDLFQITGNKIFRQRISLTKNIFSLSKEERIQRIIELMLT